MSINEKESIIKMKRGALYARVSTYEQMKNETIVSQVNDIKEYAKNNNIEIINQYIDNGCSGTNLNRPDIQRLLKDLDKKIFDVLLISRIDRLVRGGSADFEKIINKLKANKVNLIGTKSQIQDIYSREGNLFNNIMVEFANYERYLIIDRTMSGKIDKAKRGIIASNRSPYGYTYIPKSDSESPKYVIDPDESKIVKKIFDMYTLNKLSIRGIVNELNKMKVPPRNSNNGNTSWARSTIGRMLRNETYAGTTYYCKHESIQVVDDNLNYKRKIIPTDKRTWIPIKVPNIISKNQFLEAQVTISRNKVFSSRNAKNVYLLSGLLYCMSCGSKLYGEKKGKYRYYRCSHHTKIIINEPICKAPSININSIDPVIKDLIMTHVNKLARKELIDRIDQLMEYLKDNNNKEPKIDNSEIEKYTNKISKLEKKIEKLLKLYLDDKLDEKMYDSLNKQYRAEIRKYKDYIQKLKSGETYRQLTEADIEHVKNTNFMENFVNPDDNNIKMMDEYYRSDIRFYIDKIIIDSKSSPRIALIESRFPFVNNKKIEF